MQKYGEKAIASHAALIRKINDRGKTIADVSTALGMRIPSLQERLRGEVPWRWQEVAVICDYLGIQNPIGFFAYTPLDGCEIYDQGY